MEITKNQVLKYINDCEDLHILITILELVAHKTGVNTISEISRLEGQSANGVRGSKNYKKILIGIQLMTFPKDKGLRDNNLPF